MVFTTGISQAPARECPLHFRSIVYLVSNLINNSPSPSSRAHYYLVLQTSVCVKKSRRSITRRYGSFLVPLCDFFLFVLPTLKLVKSTLKLEKSTLMSVKSTLKLVKSTLMSVKSTLKLILPTLKLIFQTLKS